jgi:hypothetical protein
MTETQTHHKKGRKIPLAKGNREVLPGRERERKPLTSRARAVKLGEIVKEMKEITVVADRIVAVAAKQKRTAALSQARELKPPRI